MLDLVDKGLMPSWSEHTTAAGHPTRMPNPDRALAEGDPLYTSFVDVFGDDVSGNVSKSWNKHWNIYMTHCNLPRGVLQRQSHNHFTSMSPRSHPSLGARECERNRAEDPRGARFRSHANTGRRRPRQPRRKHSHPQRETQTHASLQPR